MVLVDRGMGCPRFWRCEATRREEHPMTTVDFITALFCRIDDKMQAVPKHPQAHLYPSEVVTLARLFALKGVGPRAFYRWLVRDYRPLFPRLPDRTRLVRLFATHQDWADLVRAHARRDVRLATDDGVPSQEGCTSGVAVLHDAPSLHRSRV